MISRLSATWADLPGTTRGIVMMLLSTLGFSAMHAIIRHLSADLHPLQITFFRNFFGLIVFVPWFLRYGLAPLRTQNLKLHALRAALNVCAMFAFFTALGLTPIARVTALSFTAPIFATLLAMAVLGETFRLRRSIAIVCGFLGTLVVLRPGFQSIDTGSLLTLLAALLWGCTLIVIKVLARSESAITITSYMNILLTILSVVPALMVWRTPVGVEWLWLLAVGVLGTLAQIAIAQSLKEAETGVVMPFDFCKLIWVSILGYLFFAEVPGVFVWAGGAIIFAASTYIAIRESRLGRAKRARRGDDA
ncbi:MAG: DMT family transporter [Proteobacteria bacterium]|nr:DMT family transporter [Pseudomonadota bacterium]